MNQPLRFDRFTVSINGRQVFAADQELAPGTIVALTGRDGSELTAVLAAITRTLDPTRPLLPLPPGTAIDGTVSLTDDALDDIAATVPLAVMSRDHELLGALTATENVALGVMAAGTRAGPDAVDAALDAVGVTESARQNLAEQLSGGQQQRTALARALVVDAAVTLLDDPASELDAKSTQLVVQAITATAARGNIVIVGHSDNEPLAADAVHMRVGRAGRHAR